MADISTHIQAIQNASRGEAVRDSIIEALDAVNNQGGNANTIDGHPAEDFVTASDLQAAMETIKNNVDRINGVVINGGITSKLSETSKAKDAIADAILDMGGDIKTTDSFGSYADKIREITTGGNMGVLDVTEDGTYYAESDDYDGYKQVNVDTSAQLTEIEITANGIYTPQGEGVKGFSRINVNVAGAAGGTGPFSVTFMAEDRVTVLKRVSNVPAGGYAECDVVPSSGSPSLVFAGWNPSNYNIQSNTICYPTFIAAVDTDPYEITDPLETIIAKSASYPIGSYFYILLNSSGSRASAQGDDPVKGPIIPNSGVYTDRPVESTTPIIFQKAYNGEDGTASTWLAKVSAEILYYINYDPYQGSRQVINACLYKDVADISTGSKWSDTDFCKWLNGDFLERLIPTKLRNAIKTVTKYTTSYDQEYKVFREVATKHKIWIPSLREINYTGLKDFLNTADYSSSVETHGPIYSSLFNEKSKLFFPIYGNPNSFSNSYLRTASKTGGKPDNEKFVNFMCLVGMGGGLEPTVGVCNRYAAIATLSADSRLHMIGFCL